MWQGVPASNPHIEFPITDLSSKESVLTYLMLPTDPQTFDTFHYICQSIWTFSFLILLCLAAKYWYHLIPVMLEEFGEESY